MIPERKQNPQLQLEPTQQQNWLETAPRLLQISQCGVSNLGEMKKCGF